MRTGTEMCSIDFYNDVGSSKAAYQGGLSVVPMRKHVQIKSLRRGRISERV